MAKSIPQPPILDRVKELRRVPAGDLHPSPLNWRTHPPQQAAALRGVLAEVGIAGAVLARERPDGSLELIDGHLRRETLPADQPVPVLVLDVTEAEARTLLATFDPIGGLAGTDQDALAALLQEVQTTSDAVAGLLAGLADAPPPAAGPVELPDRYQVLVEFDTEGEQAAALARFTAEGLRCRSLIS